MRLKKIISGGQTGADQGALDGARSCGFPYGGAIPAGRKTEAGTLPEKYCMVELSSHHYPDRTVKNVVDADGTLIVSSGSLSGGSLLTSKVARDRKKQCMHIDFDREEFPSAVKKVIAWVSRNNIEILNVAGPRASSDSGIYDLTRRLITDLLSFTGSHHGG